MLSMAPGEQVVDAIDLVAFREKTLARDAIR